MGWKEKITDKGKKIFEGVKETVEVLTPPQEQASESPSGPHEHYHPPMETNEPCGYWCFILGVGCSMTCPLPKGHAGDHRIELTMVNEPKCHFSIYWSMDE